MNISPPPTHTHQLLASLLRGLAASPLSVVRGWVLLVIVSSAAMIGCSERFEDSLGEAREIGSPPIWDAGIALVGETTTLVVPLDAPEVERLDDILAITSSCECTSATPREYLDEAGRRRVGIRIDILEPSESSPGQPVARLAVLLTIRTRSGIIIEQSVRVLSSREVTSWDPEFKSKYLQVLVLNFNWLIEVVAITRNLGRSDHVAASTSPRPNKYRCFS